MTLRRSGRRAGCCILSVLLTIAAAGGLGSCIVGCTQAYANPYTKVSVNPFSKSITFYDSKDNNIEVEGLHYDASSNGFDMQKLTIRNNASDVRIANVPQMQEATKQIDTMQKNFNAGMGVFFDGMTNLAGALSPLVGQINTATQSTCEMTNLLSAVLKQQQAQLQQQTTEQETK